MKRKKLGHDAEHHNLAMFMQDFYALKLVEKSWNSPSEDCEGLSIEED